MKKKYFILLCFISSFKFQITNAQQVISVERIRTFTPEQIDSVYSAFGLPSFIVPVTYTVDVYKLTYNTVSYDGVTPTFATGALLVPRDVVCKKALISYQHGTTSHRHSVSSYLSGEFIIGLAESTDGYVVSMPDYLGLGDGPGFHPYIHAASEASASLDMLRAVREVEDSLNLNLNGQLFLVGYSQGGHATMALHRLIETQFPDEFTVTASAPMSGPYDVSGVQAEVIVNDSVYSQPGYLPYILKSYNMVYNFFTEWENVLLYPYYETLPPLLDGWHGMGELNAAMPAIPNQIMIPEVLDSFRNDMDHYFRHALRDNDVYDWTPQAPLKMFYCEADDEVDYRNAIVAYNKFIENGATSVSKQSAGENFGHFECALFALQGGKNWFDTFRPNPIQVSFDSTLISISTWNYQTTVTGGVPPYSFLWSNGDTTQNLLNAVGPGYYYLTVTDAYGCIYTTSVYASQTENINERNQTVFRLFPNPFSETTSLQFEEAPKNARLEILDLSGKLLRSEIISGKKQVLIERKNLYSGTYFLRVKEKEKGISFAKLVIY